MSGLTEIEAVFLGSILESVFYGAYCVLFALYLNVRKKSAGGRLIYPLSALFILCTLYVGIDYVQEFFFILRPDASNTPNVTFITSLLSSLIYSSVDFISQGVLIYRCWVMWGRNPLFIVIPSILSLVAFAMGITLVGELIVLGADATSYPTWFIPFGTASFALSLAVNTIVTAILILKLALVHRQLGKSLVGQGGLHISALISLLVESGMLTFFSQLIWVVLFNLENVSFGSDAIGGVTTLACGIAPTAVIVRVAMGRSYETRLGSTNVESMANFARPNGQATSITVASVTHVQRGQKESYGSLGQSNDALEKGVY